jgi:hypothetical protein
MEERKTERKENSKQKWDVKEMNNVKKENEPATCLHSDFLVGLFFNPEDGGDTFLRNVG